MATALCYDSGMAHYRFPGRHPMLPERFTLAVDLMEAWGLLGDGGTQARLLTPTETADADLLRVHTERYLAVVRSAHASAAEDRDHGLGPGDTPRFADMHAISALVAGGTVSALDAVVGGTLTRAFNPAGGLHHAHADRAAGFCVYNDPAIAIARATALHPRLRVAYVDIDAHHGDGVEEAFWDRDDVLTVSLHESGRYLYPGTGASRDIGAGDGRGFAVNVPLPPFAGPPEYEAVFELVVEPALEAFGPNVIVAQLGADAHRTDPLTQLGMTVAGHADLVRRICGLADRLCGGRVVATGGGGYEAFSATPRMWAAAMAVLLGDDVPESVPAEWLDLSASRAAEYGIEAFAATGTFDEAPAEEPGLARDEVARLAERAIAETIAASPLLGGGR